MKSLSSNPLSNPTGPKGPFFIACLCVRMFRGEGEKFRYEKRRGKDEREWRVKRDDEERREEKRRTVMEGKGRRKGRRKEGRKEGGDGYQYDSRVEKSVHHNTMRPQQQLYRWVVDPEMSNLRCYFNQNSGQPPPPPPPAMVHILCKVWILSQILHCYITSVTQYVIHAYVRTYPRQL